MAEPDGSTPEGNDEGQEVVFNSAEEAERAAAGANGANGEDAEGALLLVAESDTPPDETPQEETPEDEAPEFSNLLKKYGGDRAKAGRAFWDAQTRAADATRKAEALERENETLRARGASPAPEDESEPDEPSDPDLTADLEWHTQGIQATQAEITAHQREQFIIGNTIIPQMRDAIIEAKTELKNLAEDDPKRPAAITAYKEAVREHNGKVDEWKAAQREIVRGQKELHDLERAKGRIERDLKRSVVSATRAKQETQQFKDSQSREFGSLATEAFAISGLPDSEQDRFHRMLKRQVVGVLDEIVQKHGKDTPALDLRKLVMSEAEELTGVASRSIARAATSASRTKAANNAALRGNSRPASRANGQPAGPSGAPARYVSPEEEAQTAMREARRQLGVRRSYRRLGV